MAKKKRDIIETWIDNPKRILVGGLVVGLGSYGLYRLGKHLYQNHKQSQTQAKAGESVETQQATNLKNAMNPSGVSWLKSVDGTNAGLILSTAAQITDISKVITAYKHLYQADLLTELQSELTTDDYNSFLQIVRGNSQAKGTTATAYAKPQQLIVAIKDVFIRKTPDASYHGAWYESSSANNIVVQAKQGSFIGFATGKQQYDAKNDVKFIEVGYQFVKTGMPKNSEKYAGMVYRYWVSSSSNFVTKFNTAKEMLAQYPSLANEVKYKVPIGTLAGLSGLFPKPIITTKTTVLRDSNLTPTITVQAHTLLGNFVMSLDTGKGTLIKFRTIDNTERWVNANDVQYLNN